MRATTTTATAMPLSGRYTATAQALHWIVAVLMFTAIPLAWVFVNMPRGAPHQGTLAMLHESIGLSIFVLVAIRILWRAAHPAPALRDVPGWARVAGVTSHWLLYVVLIGMPVTGYLMTAASGHAARYFNLFTVPGLPGNKALAETSVWLHIAIGQWLVYLLIVLHVVATAWHVMVRRDGTLDRMLPEQWQEP